MTLYEIDDAILACVDPEPLTWWQRFIDWLNK